MTRLELREHQAECLERAKKNNVIVSLPTGQGKTLIAARLIEHFLKRFPTKRVAFLVPTRPLVEQQSRYCEEHCLVNDKKPVVQRLIGDEQAGWQQTEWDNAMNTSQIFLGTPVVLFEALVTNKYIHVDSFCLFVFDECHNAKGNSPMAAILRDGISPFVANADSSLQAPRILGLTASIIHGSLQNMQKKRQDLEILMNSTILCPEVTTKLDSCHFHHIMYPQDPDLDKYAAQIDLYVKDALTNTGQIKDVTKVVLKCSHVFCELGTTSMNYYIDKVIVQQIEGKVKHLELQKDEHCNKAACKLRKCLGTLREDLYEVSLSLSSSLSTSAIAMTRAPKLIRLLELLDKNFASKNSSDNYRGIVFVEQVALVSALTKEINDEFQHRDVRCGAVAGTGAQTQADREEQLENFKTGHVHILVATAALEEGIDVTECKFVVRFNRIATTKGHIQGAGRARHPEAEIYYFENIPENERRKEALMTAEARSDSQLSQDSLQSAFTSMRRTIDDRHPYPFGSSDENEGEVNVFNGKQILNSYCSRVLGESVSPAVELYDYVQTTQDNQTKKLSSVRYPTPDGWKMKTCSDYTAFWSGVDFGKELFSSERVKRKTQSEKEEMCFVYLVVVELRENGLLDKHNRPVEVDGFETKRKCPLRGERPPSGFGLKDSVIQSTHQSSMADSESEEWEFLHPRQEEPGVLEEVDEPPSMSSSLGEEPYRAALPENCGTPAASNTMIRQTTAQEHDMQGDCRFDDATELQSSPLEMVVDAASVASLDDPSQLTL